MFPLGDIFEGEQVPVWKTCTVRRGILEVTPNNWRILSVKDKSGVNVWRIA